MYLEVGLATGAIMAATLVLRRLIRSHHRRNIDVGLVSGGWLAEQKMSKQATSAEKAPSLKQLDAAIKRAAAEMAKAKPESNLYVKARQATDKAAMDKHR